MQGPYCLTLSKNEQLGFKRGSGDLEHIGVCSIQTWLTHPSVRNLWRLLLLKKNCNQARPKRLGFQKSTSMQLDAVRNVMVWSPFQDIVGTQPMRGSRSSLMKLSFIHLSFWILLFAIKLILIDICRCLQNILT